MKVNTNPVRGMKDFLPDEAELRERVKRTIIDTYTSFGYRKIETPILEHLNLLQSGDGGDNEKLTFKVMKRGDKLKKELNKNAINEDDLADSGLRFDLTVPLSRIFANNQGKIALPMKVIQADWVFRAERPQKGRYRQFMQCDIDVIGEKDITAEIDILIASASALLKIGIEDFTIKINDRNILNQIVSSYGFEEYEFPNVFIIIDKLDKIGITGIVEELERNNYPQDKIDKLTLFIKKVIENKTSYEFDLGKEQLDIDQNLIDRINEIIYTLADFSRYTFDGKFKIEFDPTLVRGMGYYTGMIYEIKYKDYPGSIGGGGRYDKMIGKRIGKEVPACGFSIGFERILEILKDENETKTKINKRLAILYNDQDEGLLLSSVYTLSENIMRVAKEVTNIMNDTISLYEKSDHEMYKDFIEREKLEENYNNALESQKDAYYELEVCSVFRKDNKFGKQLKKLKNLGFTHYMVYGNIDMIELGVQK